MQIKDIIKKEYKDLTRKEIILRLWTASNIK
jgi:hypothetical protein